MIVPVLIICTLLTGAGFGTYAWFTSQKVSKDNKITAGILEVGLGGQAADNTSFTIGGLVQPGDVVTVNNNGEAGQAVVEVVNNGTLNLAAISGFEVGTDADASKFAQKLYFSKLEYSFMKNESGVWKEWKPAVSVIDDKGVGTGYDSLVGEDGHIFLSEWINDGNKCTGLSGGKCIAALKPGNKMVVTFELKFDEEAGNEGTDDNYSNLTFTGLFSTKATQVKKDAISELLTSYNIGTVQGFIDTVETNLTANDINKQ